MTRRDRQSDDHDDPYRSSRKGARRRSVPVRPVEMAGTRPAPSTPPPADGRWTIRPKNPGHDRDRAQSPLLKAADIVDTRFIQDHRLGTMAADLAPERSKRWLALGLAGAVYVMGIAGLWSIYQTFDDVATSRLTPARGTEPNAPLSEPTDLRDAELIEEVPTTSG